MKQAEFERRYSSLWQRYEALLTDGATQAGALPAHYRQICAHLALAKQRRYSPELIARLNDLASRGYYAFYGASHRQQRVWMRFFAIDFPRAIASNRRYVASAALLFILPCLAMGFAANYTEGLVYSLFHPAEVRHFEAMYDPANARVGRERGAGDDWMMFAHYIYNNIGIAFRTFATGLLFGLGSVFFLVYNGLVIGGVAGHLTRTGYGLTFYPFVIGHGALELTAIVLSGAAGLRLGYSLLAPGNISRLSALRSAAGESAVIVYGASAMLVAAAAVEAFWSSRAALPPETRLGVGALLWLFTLIYLCSGRQRGT